MALLEVKKAGAPVLREVCAPIPNVDGEIRKLLTDMADTMYDKGGVGLAAPQIGLAICAVVIDVGDGLLEMVNPRILIKEGTAIDSEGCLSVPGIVGDVERAEKVRVEFINKRGKKQKLMAHGLLARCIQHELDHLEGRLFVDIAKSVRKEAKKK